MKFDWVLQVKTLCFYLHFTCCNLILEMQPTCGHHSQPACTTETQHPTTTPHTSLLGNQFGGYIFVSRVSFGTFQADKRAIFPILPSIAVASTADTISFFFFLHPSHPFSPLLLLPPFASATCCACPEKVLHSSQFLRLAAASVLLFSLQTAAFSFSFCANRWKWKCSDNLSVSVSKTGGGGLGFSGKLSARWMITAATDFPNRSIGSRLTVHADWRSAILKCQVICKKKLEEVN